MPKMIKQPANRLYVQIAEKLLESIQNGSIAAGERLPAERQLAEEFNVSRPTMREAMIALEVRGIVDIRSGSGVYVVEQANVSGLNIDANSPGPFEILEARLHIEADAAFLAAQRISSREIHQLKSLLKQMKLQAKDNASEVLNCDREFHHLIALAARNSTISDMVDWLWQLRDQSEISAVFDSMIHERSTATIIAEHQDIVDALERRDAQGASQAMKNHLQRVIREFSECSLSD